MKRESSGIAAEILAYLVECPDAQDTLEGVMDWWLLRRRIKAEVAKVREALSGLVDKGFIVERQGGDSRCRYAVNRAYLEEIRELLDASARAGGNGPDDPSGSESES